MSDQPPVPHDDWDAHWERYAESAANNPAQRMRHQIIARLLSEEAGNGTMRLVDLGSGQGDLLQKLRPLLPKAEFVGVELSESGVAISRRKVADAKFFVANLFQPPGALADVDGWATHAVCSEVLEHVDEPVAFLVRARDYLAPGARLIVTVPGGPMSAFDRHIGHRQHFDRDTIRAILEKAGFSVERVCRAGFPFFNLYRLLVIARGAKLARDVERRSANGTARFAGLIMKMFRLLFHANLRDSLFGWQLIATARKSSL